MNYLRIARLLEQSQPQLGNRLINTLQLDNNESTLARKAVAEAAGGIHSQDILSRLRKAGLTKLVKPALLLAAILPPLLFILLISQNSRQAISMCILPWQTHVTCSTVTTARFDPLKNTAIQLRIIPPDYVGQTPQTILLGAASQTVQCPAGSVFRFIKNENDNTVTQAISRQAGVLPMTTEFTLDSDTDFHVEISQPYTRKLLACWPTNGKYSIRILPDNGPQVRITRPAAAATVHPGMKLPVTIISNDDWGLGELRIYLKDAGQKPALIKTVSLAGKRKDTSKITLEFYKYTPPQELSLYADVTNNRPRQPGRAQSNVLHITLESARSISQNQEHMLRNFRQMLQKLLDVQAELGIDADLLTPKASLASIRKSGVALHAGQTAVRNRLGWLVNFAQKIPSTGELQETVAVLASLNSGPATTAIEQADVIRKLTAAKNVSPAATPLQKTQNEIIDSLQKLLGLLPYATAKMGQKDPQQADALTSSQRKEFRDKLAQQLEQFRVQQQKVVTELGALAAKNVDDFTKADIDAIQKLAAVEDRMEKFMEAAISDLSNLAKQDFGNPSLLEELISVHTDITMAKDALAKKAQEIATLAAQFSIAKGAELEANLEKWLPDKPDRIKWNMEMPSESTDLAQPELPGELEDLMGDLLEQEEDLFEAMDDLTSNNPLSGDKSMGWDAVDGPMTSMNAQGVTGNMLPNTSEISGRSGEGRTGKSSGEYVQQDAVGKGGRRTPTRLGNEAFQAGEINDSSKDSPGGATGGGKISSAGQEGLEGPTPAQLNNRLQALAAKQADLIARSHRISQKYSPGTFANYELKRSVVLMNKVHDELKAGRYKNALQYRQETLDAIRKTHDLTADPMKIARDASKELPKKIQDDIADSAGGKLPPDYSEILQKYFQRLAETTEK